MPQLPTQLLLLAAFPPLIESLEATAEIGAGVPAGQGIPIAQQGCQVTAQLRAAPPLGLQHQQPQPGMHAQAAELASRCAESSFRGHHIHGLQCSLPFLEGSR